MNQKDYYHMTQQEVADRLGISRPNVNHYEKQALEKFRIALEKRGIKPSDLLDVKKNERP
jgi:DNA-directed RNA polymerase sigma subunit (sigma70/sigma32)